MTDEEIDRLIAEISAEIAQLIDDPARPLTGKERKHRAVLRARQRTLEALKSAREKQNARQEQKALLEYVLLTQFGEKNFFIYNFMRARLGGIRW